jgi:ABC-type branched-subunit amino acid transport system substrate-binding protein
MKLRHTLSAGAAAAIALSGVAVAVSTGPAGASGNGQPVSIAWMGFETGAYAAPTRHNDINLAINQINSAGGADGHKFQYTPYDTGFGAQTSLTATQNALANHPTAFIGYPVDVFIQASGPALKASGIPVLSFAEGPAALSNVAHVPNLYTVPADGVVMSIAANTAYTEKTFHPKSVGIFHTDDTASNADAKSAMMDLQKLGVKTINEQSASDTATDATDQAIALKNDDVVFVYGFPVVEGLFIKALINNGYTGPIADDQSGDFLAAFGLVPKADLANLYYTPYCAPDVLNTAAAKAYVSAYESAYPGSSLRTATPYAYDAVEMLAYAIKHDGGNTSSKAIEKEMGTMTYHGVCGTYHADADHGMLHQITVVSLKDPTAPTLLATYQEPPVNKTQIKELVTNS